MSKKKQLEKNLTLSQKLLDYIAENPPAAKGFTSGVSYIVFSERDNDLNKANDKLVESLQKSGKKVVKAIKKSGKKESWDFVPLY